MLGLIQPVNNHMYVTQDAESSRIVNAFQAGILQVHPVKTNTIAKSIAVGNPADGYYPLRVARQSGVVPVLSAMRKWLRGWSCWPSLKALLPRKLECSNSGVEEASDLGDN